MNDKNDQSGGRKRGQAMGDKSRNNESSPKPPPPDASETTTSTGPAAISHHIRTLQKLDQEYENLSSAEKNIESYLDQLQQEETSLRLALEQSSTSLREQREKKAKKEGDEAVARLEEALMMGEGSSDSDDSE